MRPVPCGNHLEDTTALPIPCPGFFARTREKIAVSPRRPHCPAESVGASRTQARGGIGTAVTYVTKNRCPETVGDARTKRIKRNLGQDDAVSPHNAFEVRQRLPRIGPCKARLDESAAARNPASMIGSIRHKALRNYWTKGQATGLNAKWIRKLRRILAALEAADEPEGMNYPGSHFHPCRAIERVTIPYGLQPTFVSPLDGTRTALPI